MLVFIGKLANLGRQNIMKYFVTSPDAIACDAKSLVLSVGFAPTLNRV